MIADVLATGRENARTGKEICRLLGVDIRTLTQTIERERRAGVPICSNTSSPPGYYLAADQEEMKAYCRSLRRRAGEIFKTRRACLSMIDSLPAREEREEEKADKEGQSPTSPAAARPAATAQKTHEAQEV